ncbi:MAG: 3-isopropylmalate dehydratase small subunit [SAR324 cluster bacterium]|nr:3-isopropylmalate dehydratase small subunit [SAR324 cluster bacterium]
MQAFTKMTALAALLDRADVDTDAIIPKQFLKKIERTGFGVHLFHDWRYLDDSGTQPNPDFVLNSDRYTGAQILVTRDNFGCGSSREHAPWALLEYGFRAIIAPSFADIFYNNCFKNGILPVRLDATQIQRLFEEIQPNEGCQLTVDLEQQQVTTPQGHCFTFSVDPFARERLLQGLDDIGWTLQFKHQIVQFEGQYQNTAPWMFIQ